MTDRIRNFLIKNNTETSNIMYITRGGRKTVLNLADGRKIDTYAALKEVIASLPQNEFIHVNKSAVVNKRFVVNIEKGMYTMSDGCVIQGRVRTPGEHNRNRIIIDEIRQLQENNSPLIPTQEKYSALDDIPIGFAVVEVVYKDGFGMELVFRYVNKDLARIAKMAPEEICDKPVASVFPDIDKKTLIKIADVAVNGNLKNMVDYNHDNKLCVYIRSYQVADNIAGCIALDAPNMKIRENTRSGRASALPYLFIDY